MAHRHRTDKLTTKHSIIGDYRKVLLDIANFDEVDSIITGQISNNKTHHIGLTFQYMTESGIKLLAKTQQAVQEIFIVTKHKQTLLDLLQGYGLLDVDLQAKNNDSKPDLDTRSKNTRSSSRGHVKNSDSQNQYQQFERSNGKQAKKSGKEDTAYTQKDQGLSLGDHLQSDMMAKLLSAKEQLEKQSGSSPNSTGSKQSKQASQKRSFNRSHAQEDEDDLTMEDLYNPKDDNESFSDLFKNSKLDWRHFKS